MEKKNDRIQNALDENIKELNKLGEEKQRTDEDLKDLQKKLKKINSENKQLKAKNTKDVNDFNSLVDENERIVALYNKLIEDERACAKEKNHKEKIGNIE